MDANSIPAPAPVSGDPARRYRCTFTLPVDTATGISRVAKRLGVTQSALLAEMLGDPIRQMDELLAGLGWEPTTASVSRARGRSIEMVRNAVANARAVLDAVERADNQG